MPGPSGPGIFTPGGPGPAGPTGPAGPAGGGGTTWSFVDLAKAYPASVTHNATPSTNCNQFVTTSSTATTTGARVYWKWSGSGTDALTVTLWDHNGAVVDTATGTATADGVVPVSWAGGSHALTSYVLYTIGVYSAQGYSYVQAASLSVPFQYAIIGQFGGSPPYWYIGNLIGPGCSWFNTGMLGGGSALPAQAIGSMAHMGLVEAVITP